ncbi:MAG: helix-turn-helix transcriptional regulator [Peptostreptococcaceae bacterium]
MKNKIQELRKSKKITQEELAKMCGVSRQTIISLENGKYNPSILLAHKIATIFNCIIEDVFVFET